MACYNQMGAIQKTSPSNKHYCLKKECKWEKESPQKALLQVSGFKKEVNTRPREGLELNYFQVRYYLMR